MRKINKLMIMLFIVLLFAGISSVVFHVYGNITLKKSFQLKETAYPYEQAVVNLTIDLDEISKLLPDSAALMAYNYIEKITSPVSISYYKSMDDNTPVYTIKKGDVISFKATGFTRSGVTYRGMESLPTNVQGWRLARPFEVEGEKRNDDLLYVRVSDLEAVSKAWLDENPQAMASMSSDIRRQRVLPVKQEYAKLLMLRLDRVLYEEGVYLSPDLTRPVLSAFTYTIFVLAFVVGVLYLCTGKFCVKK